MAKCVEEKTVFGPAARGRSYNFIAVPFGLFPVQYRGCHRFIVPTAMVIEMNKWFYLPRAVVVVRRQRPDGLESIGRSLVAEGFLGSYRLHPTSCNKRYKFGWLVQCQLSGEQNG